jgi:hypothetical protein
VTLRRSPSLRSGVAASAMTSTSRLPSGTDHPCQHNAAGQVVFDAIRRGCRETSRRGLPRDRPVSAAVRAAEADADGHSARLVRDRASMCLSTNSRDEIHVLSYSVTQRLMSCILSVSAR